MRFYAGITIGPIYDTISNASIPAALWFASSVFSDLTWRLCGKIMDTVPDVEIYSPYYQSDADCDGIGKYHDRIIFSTTHYDSAEQLRTVLKTVTNHAAEETAGVFPDELYEKGKCRSLETFLKQYLQIHFCIMDENELGGRNCILALSPYLDSLELMKTFPQDNEHDPFRRMLAKKGALDDSSGNSLIRASSLFRRIDLNENFLLIKNRYSHIRSIPEIADSGQFPGYKRDSYFAVISADGDGMGNFLRELKNEYVTRFSRSCFTYDKEAAKIIHDFGGMPIYAGGDDLLFLAPLTKKAAEGKHVEGSTETATIVSLCRDLRNCFRQCVLAAFPERLSDEERMGLSAEEAEHRERDFRVIREQIPTVSFGVSVQYEKFPLYEAHKRSGELLEIAKKQCDEENHTQKDNILLELRKHSGQSIAILVHNEDISAFEYLQRAVIGMQPPDMERSPALERDNTRSEKVNSIIYTLERFHSVVAELNRNARDRISGDPASVSSAETDYLDAWMNFFDNPNQNGSEKYIRGVGQAFFRCFLMETHRIYVPEYALPTHYGTGEDNFGDPAMRAMVNLLLWEKFLLEKTDSRQGGEES